MDGGAHRPFRSEAPGEVPPQPTARVRTRRLGKDGAAKVLVVGGKSQTPPETLVVRIHNLPQTFKTNKSPQVARRLLLCYPML